MTKLLTIFLLLTAFYTPKTKPEFAANAQIFVNHMTRDYELSEPLDRNHPEAVEGAIFHKQYDLMSKRTFRNRYGSRSHQRYTLTFIQFENEEAFKKGRQNYLDHYGTDGGIKHGQTSIKRPPSYNILNDNTIVIFEVRCETQHLDEKWNWGYIQRRLHHHFGAKDCETIENGCGGPIKWENPPN